METNFGILFEWPLKTGFTIFVLVAQKNYLVETGF